MKGAPELVVEVVSRSNLPYDVNKLEQRCFAVGCHRFWKVVKPDYSVRVGRIIVGNPDWEHEIYQQNDWIPVELPGLAGTIAVNDIFAGVI